MDIENLIYTNEFLNNFRHDYDPRDIPNEMRNFRSMIHKPPQLASSLELVKHEDGIIKMNESLIDPTKSIIRKLTAVLNRLTDKNYQSMLHEIKQFQKLPDESVVKTMIDVVIENIKLSQGFIKLYASLAKDVDNFNRWNIGEASFSQGLSQKCLEEFEIFQKVENRQSFSESLTSILNSDDRNDREARIKRENKAIVLFLSHLFLENILSDSLAYDVANRLLKPLNGSESLDEFNLDYFISMYPIISKKFHTNHSDQRVSDLHKTVLDLSATDKLSFRLKFMIQDLIKNHRKLFDGESALCR